MPELETKNLKLKTGFSENWKPMFLAFAIFLGLQAGPVQAVTVSYQTGGFSQTGIGDQINSGYDKLIMNGASGSVDLSPNVSTNVLVNSGTFYVGWNTNSGNYYSTTYTASRSLTINSISTQTINQNFFAYISSADYLYIQIGDKTSFNLGAQGVLDVTPLPTSASSSSPAVNIYASFLLRVPPTSTISAPANGVKISGSTYTITGTASSVGVGLQKVEVSTNGGITWNLASGTNNWSYTWNLPTDGSYSIKSRATDNAGNVESPAIGVVVTVDATPPTGSITINSGATYTTSTSVTLDLSSCSDASGCAEMQFSIDNSTWSTAEAYNTSKAWTLLGGDVTKTVYVKFKDAAGNWSSAYSDTIVLDTVVPDASITSNLTNPSNSSSASFSFTATETATFECKLDGGSYALCASPVSYTGLPDGSHTFYVKATDAAGNTDATPASYAWTVDTTVPTGTISINSDATSTNSTTVTLALTCDDGSGSGCSMVRLSSDKWLRLDEPFATTKTLDLYPVDGTRTVYVQFQDAAGNWSNGYSASIILDTQAPNGWSISAIDSGPYKEGGYTSTAMDSNGKAHISYMGNGILKYATNSSKGSWVTETVDSSGYVGSYSSLSLDGNGKAHISYYDGYYMEKCLGECPGHDLKYATNASGSWIAETVDSAEDVGMYTSVSIDASGKAHISYYDSNNRDLKYATNASGTWVTETVDSAGYVGMYTSISVDGNGKAHISYYAVCESDACEVGAGTRLKYATNASGSWVADTVDSEGRVGLYTSIALDAGGKAHISYFDSDNRAFKYANNASGSWNISTVESAGPAGEEAKKAIGFTGGNKTSISIDAAGKAHMSYIEQVNGNLKYATNASGSWAATTLEGGSHASTSIALDGNGKPRIGYYDSDNMALKYTEYTDPVSINSGAALTNSASVTLTLSASDVKGVSEMIISNDGVFDTEAAEAYVTSKEWTLSNGDGTKTVYVKFKDVAGNWSGAYTDTIVLDTTPSGCSFGINSNAAYTNSTSVTLDVYCTDATSGVSQIVLSNDGVFDTEVWETYVTSKAWTLPTGDGTKTVSMRAKDNAGNSGNMYTDSITLDSTAPTVDITSPATGPTNDSTPLLTFAVSDGTVVVKVDGVVVSKVSSDSLDTLVGGSHTLRVESTDAANNSSYAEVTFTVDTDDPVFTSTSPVSDSFINTLTAGYTLSEDVSGGSITFTRTGGTADSTVHLYNFTASDKTAGTHSINTGLPLVNGATYTATFEATDQAGNNAAVVSNANVTYDTSSASVVINSPASNSVVNTAAVGYTLNEDVSAGDIVFTWTGGTADGMSPHTYALSTSERTAGDHAANTTLPLMDGAIYTVSFETVADKAGNPTSSVSNTDVKYDSTAVVITGTSPTSNSIITTVTVGYTLSEQASGGKVIFTRTGGKADSNSPHVYNLASSDLYSGAHTISTNLTLQEGTFYTVSFEATDMAGNPATTVSNASVYYDSSYGQLPIGNIDNRDASVDRVDGNDLIKLSLSFGSRRGDSNWKPVCDLDNTGSSTDRIDGNDLIILGIHFGEVK